MARIAALVYNWWTLFTRLAIPDKHGEAITTQPLLLHGIARRMRHGHQTTVTITSLHARTRLMKAALQRASAFLQWVQATAEQLTRAQRWRLIPASHRGIPILATVRNPFERYVSQYEFAWWKRDLPPWVDVDAVRAEYPHFPNLSFEEFVTGSELLLQQYRNSAVPPERRLGLQSEQFVRFFFRQPEVFAEIDDHYIEERRFEVDVFPVTFLRTHRLNQDLHDYLVAAGFESDRVRFILDTPRVRPPGLDGETRDWSAVHHESHYYTPELRRLVRTREKLLLAMFPEFDA